MDDRKKRISELEHRKREQTVQLDALLIRFGEGVFGRMADSPASGFPELAVYQGYQLDIANSQASIQAAEEQILRSKELDQNIEAAERKENENAKDLSVMYSRLGKMLLGENSEQYAGFCAPYRDQNEALLTKVMSLGERLDELDKKEGGNVFTWIGKGAQSLVLRSFMTKAQESLEQLRRNAGECYIRDRKLPGDGSPAGNAGIESLCSEIEDKLTYSRSLSSDIAALREERRKISSSYSAEGGPVKHINTVKNHIASVQNDLRALYRRIGAEYASIELKDAAQGLRRQALDSLLLAQDGEAMESASRINKTIRDCEEEIKKLEALLAIDDENAKIEKYRKMIQEKRERIAKAEQDIEEYEEGIRDSESFIQKLQNLL